MKRGEEVIIYDELRAPEGEWSLSLTIISKTEQTDRIFDKLAETALALSHDSVSQMVSKYRYDTDYEEEEPGEYFDERTLFKACDALQSSGLSEEQALNAIRILLNAGILLRERR